MNKSLILIGLAVVYTVILFTAILSHFPFVVDTIKTTNISIEPFDVQPTLTILVVGDRLAAIKYEQHWKSLKCYADKHNYTYIHNLGDESGPCGSFRNYFFRKHCIVQQEMKLSRSDWFLILDGDTFVVDMERKIEFPKLDWIDIVHYERFHNGEIAAGNYLIRNTNHSHDYLIDWANWEQKGVSNHDNGALHLLLLSKIIGNHSKPYQICNDLFSQSNDLTSYDKAIGCVKCILGKKRLFLNQKLWIVRRGHFFVRDFFVSSVEPQNVGLVSPNDIFFHGYKANPSNEWWQDDLDHNRCELFRLKHTVNATVEQTKQMIVHRDLYSTQTRPNSVGIADVSHCWPNCLAELSTLQEIDLRYKLCPTVLRISLQ